MTLRRRLKYLLYTFVPGLAGRFPYYGTRLYFPPGAPVFREICERGGFEPDVIDRMVAFARPASTVFDVGANVGLMAIPVLRRHSTCRVVSFEPSPNSLPYLERTARGSGFADRWIIVGKALAAAAGALDFAVGHPKDALFEGLGSAARIAGARLIKVPVSTLDDEWIALGKPAVSLIKIDVEGAEYGVLAGARQMVRACHPAVLLEWHEPYLAHFGTPPGALLAWAREHGLRVFTVPAGVPVDDTPTLTVQMMNCSNYLLLPPE